MVVPQRSMVRNSNSHSHGGPASQNSSFRSDKARAPENGSYRYSPAGVGGSRDVSFLPGVEHAAAPGSLLRGRPGPVEQEADLITPVRQQVAAPLHNRRTEYPLRLANVRGVAERGRGGGRE